MSTSVPASREEFKQYCLRGLGAPVIKINLDDDQVEDRISEALSYYADYHFDATNKIYYKHQVSDQDKVNKYITIPENILGMVQIFPIGNASNYSNMFSIRYQIALNDLYTFASQSMVPYFMTMQQVQFIEQLLVGVPPIRYNRHMNQLAVDMDWSLINTGEFLLVEAYEVVDPQVYTDVWKDRWLYRYTTCLLKQQWGSNLKKFKGVQMPGGVTFSGQEIYNEATLEKAAMEKDMLNSYSLPVTDMIG
jgi:hypothetical protein